VVKHVTVHGPSLPLPGRADIRGPP
jgi:hypothetical protein